MMFLAVLLCVVAIFNFSTGDKFDSLDRNFDGHLDRTEFEVLAHELHEVLEPFTISGDSLGNKKVAFELNKYVGGDDFVPGAVNSLVMIIACEIGDKTFFIAAVLAMRHGRAIVYMGSMLALALMHILSCLMGYALPAFLPKVYTHYASALLFVYFGIRLLKDGQEMGDGPSEELQEVEEELIEKKDGGGSAGRQTPDVEEGQDDAAPEGATVYGMKADHFQIFTQAFTLTFLAEWGDRSQIATIALASSKNPYGVILGGLVGHAFCTALAVVGGRMLAARISERTVALVGGTLFLLFAIHSLVTGVE